jgi:flavin reductase (DIM6/NTAB) family NADH-FMN oxidoreductase RutF
MSTHSVISPAIYYWGTPVVLITTINEDNTPNIAPMSSAFCLGNRCMLGLKSDSQTTINLLRTKQCVLNLPSDDMAASINALARTTGSKVVPDFKVSTGYRYEKDKFGAARLTPQESERVAPPRILECPAQMEAEMAGVHEMMSSRAGEAKGFTLAVEVRIVRTHVVDALRLEGHGNRIDPDAWRPMIMSFQRLYGLKSGGLEVLTLAGIEEELYRLPAEKLAEM